MTLEEMDKAAEEWGANCGPGALAAITRRSLAEIRPHMGNFEAKHYTNPMLMWRALNSLGVRWKTRRDQSWPDYGLARIQWHGPWTEPGAPRRARERHTHWVGVHKIADQNIGIFDINALGNGTGWCHLSDWDSVIVPWILEECEPEADGHWSITHSFDVVLPDWYVSLFRL